MGCDNDYCDLRDGATTCPRCGAVAVLTFKALTAWLRCPKCGRIATGRDAADVLDKWEKEP